jgi:hypothetical protein
MRRLAVIFALSVLAGGCASMSVSSHIEHGVNFAGFVTYNWGPPDNLPVGDPRLDNNPFFKDHLMGAVEKALAAKGFTRTETGTPDLLVHYHASVSQRLDVYEADNRYGYCYADCQPQVNNYDLGTLIIDIVDTRTNKVVWRGWAQDAMNGVIDNQARLEKQVDEGVTKMMQLLPNGGSGLVSGR